LPKNSLPLHAKRQGRSRKNFARLIDVSSYIGVASDRVYTVGPRSFIICADISAGSPLRRWALTSPFQPYTKIWFLCGSFLLHFP